MTETATSPNITEPQKAAAGLFGSMINSTTEPLLKAQADLLSSVETTITAWLRRRQEGVVETQALVTRLRANHDPAEFVAIHQEWVSGTFRRLSADAVDYQSAAQQLAERARSWFPQVAEVAETVAAQATEATRVATRTLRVANKAAE